MGKHSTAVVGMDVVATIARELSGFVWAIAQQVKPAH